MPTTLVFFGCKSELEFGEISEFQRLEVVPNPGDEFCVPEGTHTDWKGRRFDGADLLDGEAAFELLRNAVWSLTPHSARAVCAALELLRTQLEGKGGYLLATLE